LKIDYRLLKIDFFSSIIVTP